MEAALDRPMPGGPLSVDLLNTAWMSDQGPVDWLDNAAAVASFVEARGHDPESDLDAVRESLRHARELIRRFFEEVDGGIQRPSLPLIDALNGMLASSTAILVPEDDSLDVVITSRDPHQGLAVEAVVDALELQRERSGRIRSCEHENCTLWFLDTSRGGRRRWCSMEGCGNRAKARRHYERSTNAQAED